MRVLILCHEWPPIGGGAGLRMRFLTSELARRGHEFDVITASWRKTVPDASTPGVRLHTVPVPRKGIHESYFWGPAIYVRKAWPVAKTLAGKQSYDLCHAVMGLPAGAVAWQIVRKYSIPYLVSLEGADVPGYDPVWRWLHLGLRPVDTRVWHAASHIVAVSEGLKSLMLKTCPDLPIHVIPNAVDTDRFKPRPITHIRRSHTVRLISVCRVVKRKGLQHLLQALADLPDLPIKLNVAGTGAYLDELIGLCRSTGLSDRVTFLGHVPNENLPNLYAQHDLFVLPSLTESFGIVFAEAMACGLPVIGSTAGGIPEVVRDGEDGLLVEPGNVEQLKHTIVQLVEDKGLRQQMGRSAACRVHENFACGQIADQYEELYRKVADSP